MVGKRLEKSRDLADNTSMIKDRSKIVILILSTFFLSFVLYAANDVKSIKKELKWIRVELKTTKSSSNRSRLMKRMAELENKLTESSSADRKESK